MIICIIQYLRNRSYRLAAYCQFTNWKYNFLTEEWFYVACVVTAIRLQFPEPDNLYTGFKAAELK